MGVTRLAAMPGQRLIAPLFVVALASVAALSACGSSGTEGEIPQSNAAQLNADLEAVRTNCENGDAESAAESASRFKDHVNSLPDTAGEELKQNLRDAQDNLAQLIDDQCGATSHGEERSTTESSTAPTSTSTATTTTSTSSTSTSSTDETETQPNGNGGGPPGPPGGEGPRGGSDGGGSQGGGGTGGTGDETGGTGGDGTD